MNELGNDFSRSSGGTLHGPEIVKGTFTLKESERETVKPLYFDI